MSKKLNQLKDELENTKKEASLLWNKCNRLEQQIKEQQLDDWLEENNIVSKGIRVNQEMFNYICRVGFPGGYIEDVLDVWKPGQPVTMRYKFSSGEYSVAIAPDTYHPGLFPPDMVLRAVQENEHA